MKTKHNWRLLKINDSIMSLLNDIKGDMHFLDNDIILIAIRYFKQQHITEEIMINFMQNYPVKNSDPNITINIDKSTLYKLKKIKWKYKIHIFLYQLTWIILLLYKHKQGLFPHEVTNQTIKQYNHMKKFIDTINNFNEKEENNEIT